MPPLPETATRKRLVGELKQVLEDNAATILGGSKKSQPQLAPLKDFVNIDRNNTTIKTKGAVPETGPTKKYDIDADRLLKKLGLEIKKVRSLTELRATILAELDSINAQNLENLPTEASAILEKKGLLAAVNTLLTPKEQEKTNVSQLLQEEVARTNEKRNQELEDMRQKAAQEYKEKKKDVLSAIEKELATLLREMTDTQQVLRHGATSVHTQITKEKSLSLFSKILSRLTSSRGPEASEKLIDHAQAGDTYKPPFASAQDFLTAVGLSVKEQQRARDFNDLNRVLHNTYEQNQRQLEQRYADEAATITTLEELRTSFASHEAKQLIAAQEGIARALALINGRGVAQFERRTPAKSTTGLYSRTKPFTKLQNEVTQALSTLRQLAA
jgi:DNA anti-recombination protein RmuC